VFAGVSHCTISPNRQGKWWNALTFSFFPRQKRKRKEEAQVAGRRGVILPQILLAGEKKGRERIVTPPSLSSPRFEGRKKGKKRKGVRVETSAHITNASRVSAESHEGEAAEIGFL